MNVCPKPWSPIAARPKCPPRGLTHGVGLLTETRVSVNVRQETPGMNLQYGSAGRAQQRRREIVNRAGERVSSQAEPTMTSLVRCQWSLDALRTQPYRLETTHRSVAEARSRVVKPGRARSERDGATRPFTTSEARMATDLNLAGAGRWNALLAARVPASGRPRRPQVRSLEPQLFEDPSSFIPVKACL